MISNVLVGSSEVKLCPKRVAYHEFGTTTRLDSMKQSIDSQTFQRPPKDHEE
jgi:hypothetical protein